MTAPGGPPSPRWGTGGPASSPPARLRRRHSGPLRLMVVRPPPQLFRGSLASVISCQCMPRHNRPIAHTVPYPTRATGAAPARARAWADICRFGCFAPARSRRRALRGCTSDPSHPAVRYVTAGISHNSPSRIASWSNKLRDFLNDEAFSRGHARETPAMVADS